MSCAGVMVSGEGFGPDGPDGGDPGCAGAGGPLVGEVEPEAGADVGWASIWARASRASRRGRR